MNMNPWLREDKSAAIPPAQKKLDDLWTPAEFSYWAKNHGAEVDARGFNVFVRTKRGVTVYPRRDGDLPKLLQRHLVQIFRALGLGVVLVIVALRLGAFLWT